MSLDISVPAQMMESKIQKLDRVYQDIFGILRKNPQCLDGNTRKDEVLETLIVHLTARLETRTAEERPNRALVIRLAILVDCYEDDANDAKEYFWKVLECLFEMMNAQELKYIPQELKNRALDICVSELRKMTN